MDEEQAARLYFMPVDTASASTDDVAMPLRGPGSSVAAAFVNGDMKMGAIGTVTYVDNDHIVAFDQTPCEGQYQLFHA